MKNLLLVRIPSTCICFTLIVLVNLGLGLLWGEHISPVWLILFAWLVACQFIDLLISKIEFRKWSHYCVTESVILYLLSLFVSRMFIWDDVDISRLISFTAVFLVTDGFIFWYFHKRQEMQAEEINRLIQARERT